MYCLNCGRELPEGTRFCHYCGAEQTAGEPFPAGPAGPEAAWQEPAPEPAWQSPAPGPAAPAKGKPVQKERVLPGIIGAVLGVISVLLMGFAGEATGTWIGIQGMCMGLAVFAGYRMLAGRLGVPGTVICAIVTVAAVCSMEAFLWMLFGNQAYLKIGIPAGDIRMLFMWFGVMLKQGLSRSFYPYLAQAVLFALLGGALLAAPDLRVHFRRLDRQPKLWPGLIYLATILLSAALFAGYISSGDTEEPRSPAYRDTVDFIQEEKDNISDLWMDMMETWRAG